MPIIETQIDPLSLSPGAMETAEAASTATSTTTSNTKSKYTSWTPHATLGSIKGKRTAQKYNPETGQWELCQDCARWANDGLRKFSGDDTYLDIYGNAWTRLPNGKIIFNGYKNIKSVPISEDVDVAYKTYVDSGKNRSGITGQLASSSAFGKAAQDRNLAAADSLKVYYDPEKLDKGKVYMVNMYYKGSPYTGVAAKEGTNGITGTHTGNMYYDNGWKVAHNIHGTVKTDKAKDILGSNNKRDYGITAISEVRTKEGDAQAQKESENAEYAKWSKEHPVKSFINKIYNFGIWKNGGSLVPKKYPGGEVDQDEYYGGWIEPAVVTAINPNVSPSEQGKKYIDGLNKFRNQAMQDFNLSDSQYADIAEFATNIANRESGMGAVPRYYMKNWLSDRFKHIGNGIKYMNIDKARQPLSRGLSQIKYWSDVNDPFLKKNYDKYEITEENLTEDPEKMAEATVIRTLAGQRYLKWHNDYKPYTYSDGTEIPADTALAIWWNRGTLTNGANANPADTTVREWGNTATKYARKFENEKLVKPIALNRKGKKFNDVQTDTDESIPGGTLTPSIATPTELIPKEIVRAGKPRRFIKALNAMRPEFTDPEGKYKLSNAQYNDVAKFAVNIANKESKFGRSKRYIAKQIMHSIPGGDAAIAVGHLVRDKNLLEPISKGFAQIKTFPDEKKYYRDNGVNLDLVGNNAKQMARQTVLRTLKGIDQLDLYNKKYHWSDGTEIPLDTALSLWWNYGRLTDGANVNPADPNVESGTASSRARYFDNMKLIQ